MVVIKKNQIEEKGTVTLDKELTIEPVPEVEALPQPDLDDVSPIPEDAKHDATKALNEAEKIIAEAQEKAATIREQAKEAGRQEGRGEAQAKISEALETLNQAIKERKEIVKDSENEILRLAIKVAEQIIRSEVSLHRDVCLNIVSEAIGRISDREQIIVRVNREDAEYLKRYKDRLAGILDGVKSFTILEDSVIEPGGCVIETSLGFIDAKIATKLKSLEEVLNKVAESEQK